MKPIKEVVAEVLTTLQQRIKWLELSHQTIINNLLDIVPKLEKHKEYRDIAISTTGSIYIYLEGDKVIRISNHAAGKSATKKKAGLVDNLVYGD